MIFDEEKINFMSKMNSTFLAAALSLGLLTVASAQTPTPTPKTPGITKRQHEQQQRIRQGSRSGSLTRGETRRLENGQRDIREDKQEAKADGVVTTQERAEIRQDQNQANRQIYRAKHNNRRRH